MRNVNRIARAMGGALLAALSSLPAPAIQSAVAASHVYESIVIEKPAADATVFDNAGDVEVTVSVTPALRNGDAVALALDGQPSAASGGTHIGLSGIPRGEHTLRAQVVDANGERLIASAPVTFHVWQASRLFPNRRKS